MVAYAAPAPGAAAAKPSVMVASAEPATDAGALPGVAQPNLPDTAPVAAVAPERPAPVPAVQPVAVAAARPAPLPENSPFALASADTRMDQGFDAAAPKQAAPKQAVRKQAAKKGVAAPAPAVEVAYAEQPAKPSRKPVIDPDSAPLPTARASMLGIAAPKPAKRVKPPAAVQMAADEPLAARFGRADDEPAVSMGFAQ